LGRIRKVVTKKEDRTRKDGIGKERRSTRTRKDRKMRERQGGQEKYRQHRTMMIVKGSMGQGRIGQ